MTRVSFWLLASIALAVPPVAAKPARPLYFPPALDQLQASKPPVKVKDAEWTMYGRLRETDYRTAEGRPIYALHDIKGTAITYIATAPSKSLQSYIGTTIAVYGPTMSLATPPIRCVDVSHVAIVGKVSIPDAIPQEPRTK